MLKAEITPVNAEADIALFQTTFETFAMIVVTNPQGLITRVNNSFCDISKYSANELVGKTINILHSGHHSQSFFSALWKTLNQGKTWRGEIKNKTKKGDFFWMDTTIIPFADANNAPAQYLWVMHDITAKKQAKEELTTRNIALQLQVDTMAEKVAQTSAEVNKLFDNISEVYFSMDLAERRFVQVSSSCFKLFGYTRDELMANYQLWRQIAHAEDIDILIRGNEEALAHHREVINRYRIIHKTMGVRRIQIKMIPTLNAAGQPIRLDGICWDITEKEADQKNIDATTLALKASERKFRMMFDNSLEGLLIAKPDGAFHEVNDAFCRMLDYTREEFLKLTRPDVTVVDDPDLIRSLKIRKETGRYSGPMKLRKKDGEIIDSEISSALFHDETGDTFSYVWAREITEKHKAELALQKNEKRFRALIEKSRDIISLYNADGTVQYRSPSYQTVLGYTPEESALQPLFGTMHPDDVVKIKKLINGLLSHPGSSIAAEWRQKHKNGDWRWMEGTSTNLLDLPPVNAIVNNYRDITRRKESEMQLGEALTQVTHIFNNVYEGLFAMNTVKWEYIYVSPGCEKIYGYSLNDFYNNPQLWRQVIHPHDIHIVDDAMSKLNSGLTAYMQYRIYHKDSSIRWIEVKVIPELDTAGQLIRMDGIVMDITDRKEAEMKLEALNHSLEKQVADRTVQLHDANKALESFSYSVAHDLKAPLRILAGYARIFEEDYNKVLDTPGKELLRVMISNSHIMNGLITDLLNFSRVTRVAINSSTINFDQLVAEVIESVKQTQPAVNPGFKLHSLGFCQGDGNLLRQVWTNLIGNAVKYSGKNPDPVIEIGTATISSQKVFYIKDNGIGFDMGNAEKLFSVFFRMHKSDQYEGTGVGLAIAHNIVTRHGGKIWAEAEMNKGATFYFYVSDN